MRRRGIWLGEEDRGRGIGGGAVGRGTQGGELEEGIMEGCGLGTITGRAARDGDRVAGRGVAGVVVGTRSRVPGMRARGLGARVGGETGPGRGGNRGRERKPLPVVTLLVAGCIPQGLTVLNSCSLRSLDLFDWIQSICFDGLSLQPWVCGTGHPVPSVKPSTHVSRCNAFHDI